LKIRCLKTADERAKEHVALGSKAAIAGCRKFVRPSAHSGLAAHTPGAAV
jgi:hypothetical protein